VSWCRLPKRSRDFLLTCVRLFAFWHPSNQHPLLHLLSRHQYQPRMNTPTGHEVEDVKQASSCKCSVLPIHSVKANIVDFPGVSSLPQHPHPHLGLASILTISCSSDRETQYLRVRSPSAIRNFPKLIIQLESVPSAQERAKASSSTLR
jgi:hypothetical protein